MTFKHVPIASFLILTFAGAAPFVLTISFIRRYPAIE
jgi:hypothetical protein